MRILQLNNMGIQWGLENSAEAHFRQILEARDDLDFRILRDKKLETFPNMRVVTPSRFTRSLPWSLRSLFRLGQAIRIIRRDHVQLVHSVALWPHGVIGWLAARLLGRKCCITMVGGIAEIYRHGRWMHHVALFCLRRYDVVTVTGRRTRDFFVEKGVDPNRIVLMPNVADVEKFRPDPSVPKEYDVVSTNRLYPVKNLGVLLRAVAKVKEERPDLRVAMGGSGSEEANLKALAKELGLEGTVEFLGWLDDIPDVLRRSRLFLLTSRAEGFPIAVLEAMATGVPCVVSNVGDMPEVARDGWNARVIEDCDDLDAFAEAILSLLEDPELYERISRNALAVRETHSFEAASRIWKQILDRIEGELESAGPRPPARRNSTGD